MTERERVKTLSVREAAERAGVSDKTLRRWLKSGRLRGEKVVGAYGLEYHIPAEAVRDAVESVPGRVVEPVQASGFGDALRAILEAQDRSNGALRAQLAALSEQVAALAERVPLMLPAPVEDVPGERVEEVTQSVPDADTATPWWAVWVYGLVLAAGAVGALVLGRMLP